MARRPLKGVHLFTSTATKLNYKELPENSPEVKGPMRSTLGGAQMGAGQWAICCSPTQSDKGPLDRTWVERRDRYWATGPLSLPKEVARLESLARCLGEEGVATRGGAHSKMLGSQEQGRSSREAGGLSPSPSSICRAAGRRRQPGGAPGRFPRGR